MSIYEVSSTRIVAPFHTEFLWLCLGADGIEQSNETPRAEWFSVPQAIIVCLHWTNRPYFDDAALNALKANVGRDDVFYFLINREPPPERGVMFYPPVVSFACSARVYLALGGTAQPPEAGRSAYSMAHAMLNQLGKLPRTQCLQIPLRGLSKQGAPQPPANVEWVIPHQGSLVYLDKCLQSVALTAADADDVAVCFDEAVTPAHRTLMADYPAYRFYASTPFNNGPYVGRDRLGRQSAADIVMHQDSDDLACADRRQVLLKAMLERDLDLIGSHELRVDEIHKLIYAVRFPVQVTPLGFLEGYRHPLYHPTSAIRKEALCRAGGFSTHRTFGNDTEFLFRAMFHMRIGNVDEFLYIRRKRANSLSTAPETALDSPVRRQLSQTWSRDFASVTRGELALDQASFRLQHRDDYAQIKVEPIARP